MQENLITHRATIVSLKEQIESLKEKCKDIPDEPGKGTKETRDKFRNLEKELEIQVNLFNLFISCFNNNFFVNTIEKTQRRISKSNGSTGARCS